MERHSQIFKDALYELLIAGAEIDESEAVSSFNFK